MALLAGGSMLRRFTSRFGRRTVAAAAAALIAVAIPLVLWLRPGEPPASAPGVQPTATAVVASVPLSSITLPDGCRLFDRGYWERPVEAGVAEPVRLTAAPCAVTALDAIAQRGEGIEVTWTLPALGTASPLVKAVFQWPNDPNDLQTWTATVTFSEPGQWVTDPRIGGAAFFEVSARDAGFVRKSPNLPLPAAPQTIAILDGDATKVMRTFPAERGGTGMLRNPDRAVFVQTRDGGRWLVTGDLATGVVTPLFEVGLFANIVSAPDGKAMAVEWGTSNGRREMRMVTDAGKVTTIDDGTINSINLAWSPDSKTLLADGDSRWLIAPDGTVRDRRASPDLGGAQIAWAPDSTYALLQYGGQPGRVVRLDPASLAEEVVVAGAEISVWQMAMAPGGQQVAFLWTRAGSNTSALSVVPVDKLIGAKLDEFSIAPAARDGAAPGPGLSWSPDERLLAFGRSRASTGGPPAGSEIAVLEIGSGAVRRIAEAVDFYSGYGPWSWSNDGSTLFALRYNCSACGPSSSAVDVIDVAVGRVTRTFGDSGIFGRAASGAAQLLSTPEGLLRTDGRARDELLVRFAGGIFFGPSAKYLPADGGAQASIAVQVGVGRGQQIYAARADGSAVDLLGVLGLEQTPYALIDATAAIGRGDRRWERRSLTGGATTAYGASSGAVEKFEILLSPSRRLALDFDREGFAVFDVTAPAAAAVVARRAYPSGTQGMPAWSTDEKRVAFGNEYAIGMFEIASGAERAFELDALGAGLVRGEAADRLWALTWTPSGAIEFATPRALWRLDVNTGQAVKVIDAPRPGGFTQGTVLAYSPDGRTLAAATQYGVFALPEGGTWKQLSAVGVSPADRPSRTLHWAPDASAVAFTGESGHTPEGIIVAPVDGSGAYRLVSPGAGSVLGWLADGRVVWVSTTGGT